MADGDDPRHMTGSFYTPSKVTTSNSARAIDARLEQTSGIGPDHLGDQGPERLRTFYFEHLSTIKVLDPACGDGAFLVECLAHLFELRRTVLDILSPSGSKDLAVKAEQTRLVRGHLPLDILEANIFGVDIDPRALDDCRRNLSKAVQGKGKGQRPRKVLASKLRHGDSLLGYIDLRRSATRTGLDRSFTSMLSKNMTPRDLVTVEGHPFFHWPLEFPEAMATGGFDVIVGNPPYGDRALTSPLREAIRATGSYWTAVTDDQGKGSINPSSLFIERSHTLLKQGGLLSLIVPSSITRVKEFAKTRAFMVEHLPPLHLVDEGSPFKGVTLEMFSFMSCKQAPTDHDVVHVDDHRHGADGTGHQVPLEVFRRHGRFILYWDRTFERIWSGAAVDVISGRRGPTIPKGQYTRNGQGRNRIPLLISGKTIQRYRFVPHEYHWTHEGALGTTGLQALSASATLVGTRLTDRYRVCIKPPGMMVGDNIVRLDTSRTRIPPEALCVILNSRLMHYAVNRYLFNRSGLTLFIQSVADATPIKMPADIRPFAQVGRTLLELGRRWPGTKGLMEGLDRYVADPLVFELYLFDQGLGLSGMLSTFLEKCHGPRDLLAKVRGDPEMGKVLDRIWSDTDVRTILSWN